eukprot:TRINITY_DN6336_c0_g1_i3.p1 TRINITY_DN6336_c0_g1~~TRINITY_DN6336_c0_g1_i3.p1  ORF type:complete len:135 (+),score=28.74 TRINITY_DN6336_c0_g1_i3:77-481(+)
MSMRLALSFALALTAVSGEPCLEGDAACIEALSAEDQGLEFRQLRARVEKEASTYTEMELSQARDRAENELAEISAMESKKYEVSEDDESGYYCGAGISCARGSGCCKGSTTICCAPGLHCTHGVNHMALCLLR